MKFEQLKEILEKHKKWLNNEKGGERANLREANLRRADLSEADLSEADLRRADLREADLRRADLSEADLSEADLRRADLREADLSEADLRKIKSDKKIILIQGSMDYITIIGNKITIGCTTLTRKEWFKKGKKIAKDIGYTKEQIKEYKQYIKLAEK